MLNGLLKRTPIHGTLCRSDGYDVIRVKNKYELEHRYIMAQHLGRHLSTKEQIQLNGNKSDNRMRGKS